MLISFFFCMYKLIGGTVLTEILFMTSFFLVEFFIMHVITVFWSEMMNVCITFSLPMGHGVYHISLLFKDFLSFQSCVCMWVDKCVKNLWVRVEISGQTWHMHASCNTDRNYINLEVKFAGLVCESWSLALSPVAWGTCYNLWLVWWHL